METLGTAAQLGAFMQSRLDKRHQSGGEDDPVSETDMSRDGDSPDTLSRVPPSDVDPDTLEKLRRQEREEREEIEKELRAQDNNGNKGSSLPMGLEGLEAFRRQYLASSPLSHLSRSSLVPPGFPGLIPPPPPLPPHSSSSSSSSDRIQETSYKAQSSSTPNSSQHSTPSSEFSSQQNWSFEEQFKQLYELNDDPKRKEFLDDLFSFMQKRGTPINRLPIMAKQVLDLYELYNLVCARGGLVEVINKKQWQEIIKGLNLPSSITSAAFTLRTQYTKYIYPYECQNKNLSNPNELQSAIEGNRREGRRSGYESYNMFPPSSHGRSPAMPLPPSSLGLGPPLPPGMRPNFNGNMFTGGLGGKSSPPSGSPLNALEMTRLALFKMYNQAGGLPGQPLPPPVMPSTPFVREKPSDERRYSDEDPPQRGNSPLRPSEDEEDERMEEDEDSKRREEESRVSPPPVKRERTETSAESKKNGSPAATSIGGANIRIANRGDASDSSLVVSLEINSVMYQGVLFAQPRSASNERKESQISE